MPGPSAALTWNPDWTRATRRRDPTTHLVPELPNGRPSGPLTLRTTLIGPSLVAVTQIITDGEGEKKNSRRRHGYCRRRQMVPTDRSRWSQSAGLDGPDRSNGLDGPSRVPTGSYLPKPTGRCLLKVHRDRHVLHMCVNLTFRHVHGCYCIVVNYEENSIKPAHVIEHWHSRNVFVFPSHVDHCKFQFLMLKHGPFPHPLKIVSLLAVYKGQIGCCFFLPANMNRFPATVSATPS